MKTNNLIDLHTRGFYTLSIIALRLLILAEQIMDSSETSTSDEEVKLLSPAPANGATRCNVLRVKTWTTRITIAAFFLVGGIEYSVIFPTLWDFLRGKGGEEWIYGLSLAAFSISNLFAGPLYGVVFDMTHRTKLIVLVANLFEIGGNFMYFAATSKYMIVGSRFIVGLGAGAGATLFGELARISTKRERTKVFSIYSTFRQVGLIFGPAFNLVLRLLNVDMGPFVLDRLTAPGALMTVIWVIIEIMFLFMFYRLPSAVEPMIVENSSGNTNPVGTTVTHQISGEGGGGGERDGLLVTLGPKPTKGKRKMLAKSGVRISSTAGESSPLLRDPRRAPSYSVNRAELSGSETGGEGGGAGPPPRGRAYLKFVVSRMVQEEIVVLLAVLFITVFYQTTLETMTVPIAEAILDWTETDISIFYSAAGVELIVGICAVYLVSRWVGDRWIMLGGLFLGLLGFAWIVGFAGSGNRVSGAVWKYMSGCVLLIFGLPFNWVAGASLYSKLLPMPVQGIGQGFRRSVISISAILGPLWSGSALAFSTYYVLLGVPLALLAFVTGLVLLSIVRLKEPRTGGRNILFP